MDVLTSASTNPENKRGCLTGIFRNPRIQVMRHPLVQSWFNEPKQVQLKRLLQVLLLLFPAFREPASVR